MNSSRGQEEAISDLGDEVVERFRDAPLLQGLPEGGFSHLRMQASINPAPLRMPIQDHPSFRLTARPSPQSSSLLVIGMHLDRQFPLRIDEFEQQGKLPGLSPLLLLLAQDAIDFPLQ
jgi:hypothetical protein